MCPLHKKLTSFSCRKSCNFDLKRSEKTAGHRFLLRIAWNWVANCKCTLQLLTFKHYQRRRRPWGFKMRK